MYYILVIRDIYGAPLLFFIFNVYFILALRVICVFFFIIINVAFHRHACGVNYLLFVLFLYFKKKVMEWMKPF